MIGAPCFAYLAFPYGIKSVAEQVRENSSDILHHDFDAPCFLKVPSKRNAEVLILSARAVIGEILRYFDLEIDVGRLPVAGTSARMGEHAFHNAVGPPAVFPVTEGGLSHIRQRQAAARSVYIVPANENSDEWPRHGRARRQCYNRRGRRLPVYAPVWRMTGR